MRNISAVSPLLIIQILRIFRKTQVIIQLHMKYLIIQHIGKYDLDKKHLFSIHISMCQFIFAHILRNMFIEFESEKFSIGLN